jgi:glycerate 2-kinase
VRVTGSGRGGRNLEFVLSIAESIASGAGDSTADNGPTQVGPYRSAVGPYGRVAVASVGTDGIDGSSGVAGGIVDSTTLARAEARGLARPGHYFAANDSLAFFAPLDDTVRLGRTDTNVGDLQVMLID